MVYLEQETVKENTVCSLRIEQGKRILSHFLQTPSVFSHFFRGTFPFPVPGLEYREVTIKSVLVLLKVLGVLVN